MFFEFEKHLLYIDCQLEYLNAFKIKSKIIHNK